MSGHADSAVPVITFNDRVEPQLGLGIYKIAPEEAHRTLSVAFEAGYRSIDTARQYENERAVGEVIASCGIPHEDLFTKLFNDSHGYDLGLRAFDESMAKLGLEYLDLYLIHWPVAVKDLYVETWRALEKLLVDGRTRAIGVSNFQLLHLQRLLDETGTVPAVNQIELHPWLPQDELRAFHAEHGIATVAWAPLARGGELLADPVILRLAGKHRKTPAQVVLRWHMESGHSAIPKSAQPSRIVENIDVFDFALDADDMAALATLECGVRTGKHPDDAM